MADRKLARILAEGAQGAKQALEKQGLLLEESPHIECLIAPMPGLAYAVKAVPQITLLEETMITGLLSQNGICGGAVGLDETTGEPLVIRAKSTILATGGTGQLFMLTFHPSCMTGDGYAMAYEAGAELMNMEFGQTFIAFVYPNIDSVPYPVWKLNPKILNNQGDEFIHRYLPAGVTVRDCMEQKLRHGPFSSRDISRYLDIAMVKETKAGRATERHGFHLDVKGLKLMEADEGNWIPNWLQFRGFDLRKDQLEINVAYHCSNGGLRIDEDGRTTLRRLYAVGEAASGPYGADRLGGAMMTSSQVFGARAGRDAAAKAGETAGWPDMDGRVIRSHLERIDRFRRSTGSQKPQSLIERLKRTAWENLLVVRTHDGLSHFLKEVEGMRERMLHDLSIRGASDLVKVLELRSLLLAGEMIGKAALMRTETRGSHFREDFPERDDPHWLQTITLRDVEGQMRLGTTKLDEAWKSEPDDLKGLWWG
jgi:L-aspartate oxidase